MDQTVTSSEIEAPTYRWDKQVDSSNPGYQLNTVALSADGSKMLTGTSIEHDQQTNQFSVYCFDSDGSQLWEQPLEKMADQGVFWVDVSADGNYGIAGGQYVHGNDGAGQGFFYIYDMSDGSVLYSYLPIERASVVKASADGSIFTAISDTTLYLVYRIGNSFGMQYIQFPDADWVRTMDMTPDGKTIIVGAESGDVYLVSYDPDSRELMNLGKYTCMTPASETSPVLNVAATYDGNWWAASDSDGMIVLLNREQFTASGNAVWTFSPSDSNPDYAMSYTYALAIALTSDGTVRVAAGGNWDGTPPVGTQAYGYLYVVDNVANVPSMKWIYKLHYAPNPASYFDATGSLLTAVDGEPYDDNKKETKGYFYLFNGDAALESEALIWELESSLMNWGMDITPDGAAVAGSSDNGSLYFWSS